MQPCQSTSTTMGDFKSIIPIIVNFLYHLRQWLQVVNPLIFTREANLSTAIFPPQLQYRPKMSRKQIYYIFIFSSVFRTARAGTLSLNKYKDSPGCNRLPCSEAQRLRQITLTVTRTLVSCISYDIIINLFISIFE